MSQPMASQQRSPAECVRLKRRWNTALRTVLIQVFRSFSGWISIHPFQGVTLEQSLSVVESKNLGCGFTNCSDRLDQHSLK